MVRTSTKATAAAAIAVSLLFNPVGAQKNSTTTTDNSTVSIQPVFPFITTPYESNSINRDQFANLTTTLKAFWAGNSSQGVFNDGLSLLLGTATSSITGALLQFDSASPNNATSTVIPFVALVSCDDLSSPPSTSNGTTTLGSNSTQDASNTTAIPMTNTTTTLSIFEAAAQLGAKALILYSVANQSCSINMTANANASSSIPIYSLPAQQSTQLLFEQYQNIGSDYQQYNSSLLNELGPTYATSFGSRNSSIPIPFMLATITPNQTFENTSPIIASIGSAVPAGTTTTSMPRSTATGSVGPTTSSAPVAPAPSSSGTTTSSASSFGILQVSNQAMIILLSTILGMLFTF